MLLSFFSIQTQQTTTERSNRRTDEDTFDLYFSVDGFILACALVYSNLMGIEGSSDFIFSEVWLFLDAKWRDIVYVEKKII